MILHCGDYDIEILENDKSYRYRTIRGEHTLTLYFSMPGFEEVPVGAYCEYQGQTYTLKSEENFKKNGTRNFEYTLVMQTEQADLGKWKVRHPVTKKLKFSFMATPKEHLDLLIENLNMRDGGWSAGDCIEATQKLISYNHNFCSEALDMLADEFDTEWEFAGKTIHLRKTEYNKNNPLPLSYGKGNGFLPGVGRTNYGDARSVEILYTQGGERNIDVKKYGSAELLLPKSQTLDYEGRTYESDANGFSIRRADVSPVTGNEDSLDCSHIYPMRNGTVSSVTVVDAEKHLYDIVDNGIPDGLNYKECLIDGETMTVMFQTGILTGKEFEATYIHADRRFELVPFKFEGQDYPNANWTPEAGDTYAVYGVMLPDAYISDNATKTGASWDMFREGARYLYEHEEQPFTFTGELDGIWSKQNWLNVGGKIVLGGYVSFTDSQFQPAPVLIRIVGIRDFVRRPYSPVLELSNMAISGTVVSQLQKISSNEVVNESLHARVMQFARRRIEDVKEAQKMLETAFAEFSPGIDPAWVRTMSVLVGNEFQQIEFVSSTSGSQTEVIPAFVMNNTARVFSVPAAILKHCTLGVDNTSSAYSPAAFRYWQMAAFTSPYLGDDREAYYLTAKCAKAGTAGTLTAGGTFMLQKTYTYDPGDGYYYFLVGLLSSERNGERSFATAYGFTEILPGQMRIKMIVSPDGQTYFNVAEGIIQGNIQIRAGSSGYGNLSDKPDLGVYQTKSEFNVFANQISGTVTAMGTAVNALGQRVDTVEQAGFLTEAGGNTLWARKDGVISAINQSPEAVTILASKINLVGAVTFNTLSTQVYSEMLNKLTSGNVGFADFSPGLKSQINQLSTDIAGKVDPSAIKAFAKSGQNGPARSDLADALQTEITGKLTGSATTTTGGDKLADVIVNGQTLIAGGYIQAKYLYVEEIYAKTGTIGGFVINGTYIGKLDGDAVNGLGLFNDFIKFRNPSFGTACLVGANVSPSTGPPVTARFENMNTDTVYSINTNVKITTGANTNAANKGRHVHVECGDNSGYNNYITLEHRKFSNDTAVSLRRTCIRLDFPPNRAQVNTLGTVNRHTLYWDETSKLIFWE
jgi:hypothetical protein